MSDRGGEEGGATTAGSTNTSEKQKKIYPLDSPVF